MQFSGAVFCMVNRGAQFHWSLVKNKETGTGTSGREGHQPNLEIINRKATCRGEYETSDGKRTAEYFWTRPEVSNQLLS